MAQQQQRKQQEATAAAAAEALRMAQAQQQIEQEARAAAAVEAQRRAERWLQEARRSQLNSWACSACTFDNCPGDAVCDVCTTPRMAHGVLPPPPPTPDPPSLMPPPPPPGGPPPDVMRASSGLPLAFVNQTMPTRRETMPAPPPPEHTLADDMAPAAPEQSAVVQALSTEDVKYGVRWQVYFVLLQTIMNECPAVCSPTTKLAPALSVRRSSACLLANTTAGIVPRSHLLSHVMCVQVLRPCDLCRLSQAESIPSSHRRIRVYLRWVCSWVSRRRRAFEVASSADINRK